MNRWILVFVVLNVWACTHTPALKPLPFKGFPQAFYADQILTLQTPNEQKKIRAQLQRKKGTDRFDLVLIEPLLGIVLARAVLDKDGARTEYLAPQIDKSTLPLQDIGVAIRSLYEAKTFEADGADYIYRPASKLYEYRLQSIRGPENCRYPETISLRFERQNYRLTILTETFSCMAVS